MAFFLKTWTALQNTSIQIAKKGSSVILSSLFGGVNSLYESVTGRGCPGSAQHYEGHDHCEFGGGSILPRGLVFGFDNGDYHANTYVGRWGKTDTDGYWTYAEGRLVERPTADFFAYITPGIDSSKLNISGATVSLEANGNCFVYNNSGYTSTIDIRIVNVESGLSSDEVSFSVTTGTTTLASISFDEIPVGNGGWQGYRIETSSTISPVSGADLYLNLQSLQIYETRAKSQPASSGTHTFDSTTLRTRP